MELMFGLLLTAYLAFAVLASVLVFRWLNRRGLSRKSGVAAATGVLLFAYAIPFADHTAGYLYFQHLCDKEAGDKVYRTVSNVKGFWWWPLQSADVAKRYGYTYVEGGADPHRVSRFEIQGDKVTEHPAEKLRSRYIVRGVEKRDLFLGVVRGITPVVDLHSGETLAERVAFHFRGGWATRKIFFGFGEVFGQCGAEPDSSQFIKSVLRPVNRGFVSHEDGSVQVVSLSK